jgi:hypothetical protein
MSSFTWRARVLAGSILAGLMGAAPIASALAQQKAAPPDFSSNLTGWVGLNGGGPFFEPVPGHLPPVVSDPTHPFVPNGVNKPPTFRIADLSNPNLKPWVKERMKKDIDEVLAGKKSAFTPQSSCLPAGVPFFMGYGGPDPVMFLQTPKEVWIFWTEDNQVRRVFMDVPHSANPKPSWYGESIGHYEGDTLVVDTIGLNDKTVVDVYRTPHTEKLHVVERFSIEPGGKNMTALVTVEDPDTFNAPLTMVQRWFKVDSPIKETVCSENNLDYFNQGLFPIPEAARSDF